MKWAANEIRKRGKNVYLVNLSNKSDPDALNDISEIPGDIHAAIIGITKTEPADVVRSLKDKGVNKMWIHCNTETPKVKEMLDDPEVEYITGKCPMMYLGSGLSIHGVHREVAKLIGKY
ncbi:MAG: CoA-binding protein [Methanosarcinaceae archaeon]|nr:CoA-binding protein [Methanosarcinaceae archaeon]